VASACGGERVASWETGEDPGSEVRQDERGDARGEPDEAIDVLRAVWTASGRTSAELDELFGSAKSCKNMQNVGFDDFAGSEGDIRSAWRATLEREGKLRDRPGSIADLVLGTAEHADR
jgi:hypothetical protein